MLQRLLAELANDGLQGTEAGRCLLEALQERIMAGAAVANALFAVTQAPAPLEQRLGALCEGLRRLHIGPDQAVTIQVSAPPVPPTRHVGTLEDPMEVLVHVARELVENALRHGMHARSQGRIWVRITSDGGRCVLSVSDDGWGLGEEAPGPGLALVRDLVAPHGGQVEFSRQGNWTVARVALDASHSAQQH